MSTTLESKGADEFVLRGVLRALQRSLSLAAIEHGAPEKQSHYFTRLMQTAHIFHTAVLATAARNLPQFTKQFANWALQMPVQPEESRLVTRSSLQWVRVLTTKQWEDDMKEAPEWVVSIASRVAASVFQMAPNFWLQEHAHALVERLHLESLQPGFSAQGQHFDYVEFLCRTLRKKSPTFASRNELLVALRFLNRATPQEEGQFRLLETRYRMMPVTHTSAMTSPERQFWNEHFKQNKAADDRSERLPITLALEVLLHTTRITSKNARPSSKRAM
jgi:hypothetical protein